MGTLYWQLNDCWPGPSWSSIDYYGRWKALHYALPELYDNLLIVPKQDFNNFSIDIVSDDLEDQTAQLIINAKTFDGSLINSTTVPITISANAAKEYVKLNTRAFIKKNNKKKIYLDIQIKQEEQVLAKTIHFFSDSRYLKLKKPRLEVTLDEAKKHLKIKANTFVQALYLYAENSDATFKQNYLNLEANQEYLIPYEGAFKSGQLRWLSCN